MPQCLFAVAFSPSFDACYTIIRTRQGFRNSIFYRVLSIQPYTDLFSSGNSRRNTNIKTLRTSKALLEKPPHRKTCGCQSFHSGRVKAWADDAGGDTQSLKKWNKYNTWHADYQIAFPLELMLNLWFWFERYRETLCSF